MVGLSALVFALLCAFLVPWSWVPGGHLVEVRPSDVFSDAQIRRGETYSSMQRHLGWASLAISLAVALVLGLTRLGAKLVRLVPGPWWVKALIGTLAVLLVGELAHHALRPRDPEQRAGVRADPPVARWVAA